MTFNSRNEDAQRMWLCGEHYPWFPSNRSLAAGSGGSGSGGSGSSGCMEFAHEAGYDAFMTGVCFLTMVLHGRGWNSSTSQLNSAVSVTVTH
jgi:hypothetical protein